MSTLPRGQRHNGHQPELLQTQPVHAVDRNREAARAQKVAQRPETRDPLLQAGGPVAEAQPAPHSENGAQRHPAQHAAELGGAAGPRQEESSATRHSDRSARWRGSSRSASRRTGSRSRTTWESDSASPSRRASKPGMPSSQEKLSTAGAVRRTNYWSYLNADVGTYPNTHQGYIYRGIIVLEGGSAEHAAGRRVRPDQQPRRHGRTLSSTVTTRTG